jgi:hypothetical protein
VPDESLFDSLVKLDSPKFIKVADGKLVRIEGEGKICDRIAQHVPDFDQALVPSDVFTADSYGIIDTRGIHIIPRIDSNVQCVENILASNLADNSIISIGRKNGLYPISKQQLRDLCSTPAALINHSAAHSSYFTTQFDSIGERVNFWHRAWNHLSKKKMIDVVKYQLCDDIPKDLTISAIRRHFLDNCSSCSKGSMSQKPLPRVSDRIYSVGECCAIDIKHWTVPDFSGHTLSLHAIDLVLGTLRRIFLQDKAT